MSLRAYKDFGEWVWSVEETISTCIADCHPRQWHEDHISYSWIKAVRDTKRSIIVAGKMTSPFHIAWDAFKASGKLEKTHGDIAILVKQTFVNGSDLLGVAFLEAKRIYESGRYDKLDWEQLKRQSANSSSQRLLLYDFSAVSMPGHWQNATIWPFPYLHPLAAEFFINSNDWYGVAGAYFDHFATRATVCIPQHATAYGKKSRKIHELTVPLSHQLCVRFFLGQDLDYNPELVRKVSDGFAGGVSYLIVVHLKYGEETQASVDSIEFNRDQYQPLPQSDEDRS